MLTEQTYRDAVLRNSQRIFLIALSFTRQREDAEDLTQNVFLKLWKHRNQLQDPLHTDKWLTRVTINECRNLLRFRRKTVSCADVALYGSTPEPSEDLGLIEAVLQLPKEQRVTVHLYYYEELSVREIANLLHISENAVKKRLSRARKTLRGLLKEESKNDP